MSTDDIMKEAGEKAEEAKEAVQGAAEKAKAEAGEVRDKVENTASEAKEAVQGAAEKAKAEVGEVKDKVENTASEAKAKVEETAKQAEVKAEQAKEKAEATAKKAEDSAKKAGKKAAEAVKKPNTKIIVIAVIAAIAICGGIAMMLMSGNADNSVYGKIKNYDKYIKLGKYKGLEYTKEKIKVTDKEVKQEIDTRLQEKSTTEDSKKGTVKDGDNINISYVGTINGKKFDGGTADNQTLTIGSNSMIKGFEEGLVGKKVGETVTLDLTFPKDYHEKKLRKKKAQFKVTINSKQITKTPKYDEKFIKENSDYDNKKDYEESVKKDLKKSKEESAVSTTKQTLWSQVVESSKVKKYPKGAIEEEKEAIINQYKQMAESYNMKWKEFLKTYMNMSAKKFDKQAKTYAKNVVQQKLCLYAISDKEKLNISNSEYKKKLKELLKNANMTEKQFEEQYNMSIEKYAEENNFRSSFMSEKVNDFIYEHAKAK